jgi:hypothetical protein
MTKVVYIAGYGRSGSTVLGTILGAHPLATHIGEAAFLVEDWSDPDRICSCGARYDRCEFWRGFGAGDLVEERRISRQVERFAALPRLLLGLVDDRTRDVYRACQTRLFGPVEAAGRPIIVDSSKSAWATAGRALALKKVAGYDVFVLHLVRDGWATLASFVGTGSNWAIEGHRPPRPAPALRAAIGWTAANLIASALRRTFGPSRYLRIRYEDFVTDPNGTLERVGHLIGIDMSPLLVALARGEAFPVGHVVGGNRVRFDGMVRLKRSKSAGPVYDLGLAQRLSFAVLGGWLNRLYGYRPQGSMD